jgi:hypothetical protein
MSQINDLGSRPILTTFPPADCKLESLACTVQPFQCTPLLHVPLIFAFPRASRFVRREDLETERSVEPLKGCEGVGLSGLETPTWNRLQQGA